MQVEMSYKIEGALFGRYCSLEIRNYKTGKSHTIGNEFDISFEYFKTIDEINSASVGRVQIAGLSEATFDAIKSEGGEIKLECGYLNHEITTLFIAHITRMYPVKDGNTRYTIIECSANVLNFYFNGAQSVNAVAMRDVCMYEILDRFTKAGNGKVSQLNLSVVPQQYDQMVADYLQTKSFNVYVVDQNLKTTMRNTINSFGFNITTENNSNGLVYVYSLTQDGYTRIMQHINEGYVKIKSGKKDVIPKSNNDRSSVKILGNISVQDKETEKTAIVLSSTTGLLSHEPEFKIASVPQTKALAANENLDYQQQLKLASIEEKQRKKAEKEKDKPESEKKTQKVKMIRVNREFMKIRAFLNPNVKPQTMIALSLPKEGMSFYRTRNVSFKGNNKVGDWVMEIYAEDGAGRYDSAATDADVSEREHLEDQNDTQTNTDFKDGFTGGLGVDTSYGEEYE